MKNMEMKSKAKIEEMLTLWIHPTIQ
jgi:hypothetical protein